jgi:hypothetical protein
MPVSSSKMMSRFSGSSIICHNNNGLCDERVGFFLTGGRTVMSAVGGILVKSEPQGERNGGDGDRAV